MSGSTVCIIQSRLGSTRLPGKAFMEIDGIPMIQHVMERMLCTDVEWVVVAVPDDDDAKKYRTLCDAVFFDDKRVLVVTGGEHDLLHRYRAVLDETDAAHIMRVTGDCPLICPVEAQRVLDAYWAIPDREKQDIFITNDTNISGTPDGFDVEVFSSTWIDRMQWEGMSLSEYEYEHVTTYIRDHAAVNIIEATPPWPTVKLSVDTQEDLERVRRVYAGLQQYSDILTQPPYIMEVTLTAYLRQLIGVKHEGTA